jgi:hypothetical protein
MPIRIRLCLSGKPNEREQRQRVDDFSFCAGLGSLVEAVASAASIGTTAVIERNKHLARVEPRLCCVYLAIQSGRVQIAHV